jgi:hypothetical protein
MNVRLHAAQRAKQQEQASKVAIMPMDKSCRE